MTRRRRGDTSGVDPVSKMHEDARWSMYTNSVVRWPEWLRGGRGLRPRRPGRDFFAYMLVAVVVFGGGACVIGAIIFLARTLTRP